MPYPYEPADGDPGILVNGALVPISPPLSYIPCKGETGLKVGDAFLPLEPFYHPAYADDFPMAKVTQPIDRKFPWLPQTDMKVATPCISPHDWSLAAASRTMILDTTPDEVATAEEKAVPGYVPNPGLRFASQTHAEYDLTKFDDEDGVAYIYNYAPDCGAGSFTVQGQYRITFVGTTNFTAIGASANTVGVTFTATGAGSGTGRAAAVAAAPAVRAHPLLRTGSTRYVTNPYPVVTKVGTEWDGLATLPQANPVSGVVNVCAYRYGLLLSTNANWPILVKIGKASATWAKTAKELTLASGTPGVQFSYKLSADTSWNAYTVPISVPSTDTVTWFAWHNFMVDSTTFTTAVTYDGATAPDDFETFYFSTLPAIGADQNTTISTALLFQRKPDWYISPTGTGDGLTPATASSAAAIIGLSTATGAAVGLALGIRSIAMSASQAYTANTNGSFKFVTSGAMPYGGGVVKFCTGPYVGGEASAAFTTYSGAVNIDAPGRVHFKLVTTGDEKRSRVFVQPWFMGPANINAIWDATGKTLALAYEPTPVETADISLLYSLDGSAPSLAYSGPITLEGATAIGAKAQAVHAARETHDFATQSGAVDITSITPDTTADFDEDKAIVLYATPGTITHTQSADLVWCSEGTYSPAAKPFSSSQAIVVRGGYNSDFTERDVKGAPAIFPSLSVGGVLDGIHCSLEYTDAMTVYGLGAPVIYNCHIFATSVVEPDPFEPETVKVVVSCFSGAAFYCSINLTYKPTQFIWTEIVLATGTATDCDFVIDVASANAKLTGDDPVDWYFQRPELDLSSGTIRGGTVDIKGTSGRGGRGLPPSSIPAMGGYTQAYITLPLSGSVTGTIDVSSGEGGWGSPGGWSEITADFGSGIGYGGNVEINVASGDGGEHSVYPDRAESWAECTIGVANGGTATVSVRAGNSGPWGDANHTHLTIPALWGGTLTAALSRGTGNGDSYSEVSMAVAPIYPGMLTVTGRDYGNGYYTEPDAIGDGYVGWYGGAPNGDGAPLAGHETPHGTGVSLGRFWEVAKLDWLFGNYRSGRL